MGDERMKKLLGRLIWCALFVAGMGLLLVVSRGALRSKKALDLKTLKPKVHYDITSPDGSKHGWVGDFEIEGQTYRIFGSYGNGDMQVEKLSGDIQAKKE